MAHGRTSWRSGSASMPRPWRGQQELKHRDQSSSHSVQSVICAPLVAVYRAPYLISSGESRAVYLQQNSCLLDVFVASLGQGMLICKRRPWASTRSGTRSKGAPMPPSAGGLAPCRRDRVSSRELTEEPAQTTLHFPVRCCARERKIISHICGGTTLQVYTRYTSTKNTKTNVINRTTPQTR